MRYIFRLWCDSLVVLALAYGVLALIPELIALAWNGWIVGTVPGVGRIEYLDAAIVAVVLLVGSC